MATTSSDEQRAMVKCDVDAVETATVHVAVSVFVHVFHEFQRHERLDPGLDYDPAPWRVSMGDKSDVVVGALVPIKWTE